MELMVTVACVAVGIMVSSRCTLEQRLLTYRELFPVADHRRRALAR
jgi:hypothetical protein